MTSNDHDSIIRLEEVVRSFDKRFNKLESHVVHTDECVDGMKIQMNELIGSLLIFVDPKKWLKKNFIAVVICCVVVSLFMSGSSKAMGPLFELVGKVVGG